MMHPFLAEISQTATAFRKKMYPQFVYGGELQPGETPAFVFHRVRPDELDGQFRYLAENGYSTLAADAFCGRLDRTIPSTEKAALVTFDDGFSDFYEIVFPLLVQYRMTAVLYLIPGWVGQPGMATWSQVREMHESGCVDVQSHSMTHPRIFVSDQVKGIYDPRKPIRPFWNFSFQEFSAGIADPQERWPIFPTASRFRDEKRFIPDPSVIQWIRESAATGLNIRRLRKRYSVRFAKDIPGRFETDEEQRAAIRDELIRSREAIRQYLPGKDVRHFAYPWFEWGRTAEIILKELGFRSSSVGLDATRRANIPGESPFLFPRVSGDFVRALPGDGRFSCFQIMARKAARRMVWGKTA
jgi:peptidoglycan/xylan/chitin deacetylase (PgdA/CDA1 family)